MSHKTTAEDSAAEAREPMGLEKGPDDRRGRAWTVTVRDAGGNVAWTAALPARLVPGGRAAGLGLALVLMVLVGSWVFLAVRAAQVPGMQRELAERAVEEGRVQQLAQALEEVEAGYARLRSLFADEGITAGALWLPPAGAAAGARDQAGGAERGEGEAPSLWPLVERGFLTRGLARSATPGGPGEADADAHPGIDIAVPSGSYVRAVAPGRVVERGEDPVYGLFVVLEHAGGYRSLYGHASVVVVEPGREVRRGEVLGLTGSSGMSSAPHLHLEITLNGEHLDPLTLLSRPGGDGG